MLVSAQTGSGKTLGFGLAIARATPHEYTHIAQTIFGAGRPMVVIQDGDYVTKAQGHNLTGALRGFHANRFPVRLFEKALSATDQPGHL